MEHKRGRMILTGLLALVALSLIFLVLFRGNGAQAMELLLALSPADLLLPLLLGAGYQWMDSWICRSLVRLHIPTFSFYSAWKVVHLNIFGAVASFGTASVPLQSYALHQKGIPVGAGVGLMTLEFVFHKCSILLYATVLLAAQWPWLREAAPELARYLPPAYCVIALIITALTLLCTWSKVQQIARWAAERLPETGKWGLRKEKIQIQLDALYAQSRLLLRDWRLCGKVLALNGGKLFLLFVLPFVCMKTLGVPCPAFARMQLLSALMLLITSVLPNVAGAGPTEFAFLMIFSPHVGGDAALTALLLYRLVTYYLPFLVSIFPFCTIQQVSKGKRK